MRGMMVIAMAAAVVSGVIGSLGFSQLFGEAGAANSNAPSELGCESRTSTAAASFASTSGEPRMSMSRTVRCRVVGR